MIKTITGRSLNEVHRIVRNNYKHAILMESSPADGEAPARVTIKLDEEAVPDDGDQKRFSQYGYEEMKRTGSQEQGVNKRTRGIFPRDNTNRTAQQVEQMKELIGELTRRVAGLESRFSDTIIGASFEWSSHPLYHHLLQQGLKTSTTTKLFQRLSQEGFDPAETTEKMHWTLGRELRALLSEAATAKEIPSTLAAIGPSGSGKTLLLLKLAIHENFLGRRDVAVLSLEPENYQEAIYQSPAMLYQRFGLTVETATNKEETREALDRLSNADHLLIDTPPLPSKPRQTRRYVRQLEAMLAPVMPLHTHLVLSANQTYDSFSQASLAGTKLTPDALALTFLDQTKKWGRVLEWIQKIDLPVQVVSKGAEVPEGLRAFQPSWLVEQIIEQ